MRFIDGIRTGDLFTPQRLRLWAAGLLISYVAAIGFLFWGAQGLNDYQGRPLGTDFSNIYTAGAEANAGHASDIYIVAKHYPAEKAIFGAKTPFYGWHYPPFLLTVASLLAHLPYLAALFVWQAVTFALYLGAMALLLRKSAARSIDSSWILFAVAFPAVLANLLAGHNGFLTAALLAGALAVLDEQPILAGVLFGLLAYKPQFGLMIPLALAVTGRWRSIASAAITTLALCAFCTWLYGIGIWNAFAASEHFTRTVVLEQGDTGFYRIQSVFAWARMWGGSIPLAYLVQGIVTAGCGIGIVRLWRSDASREIKGAALCIAALLATPYSLDYDLMALAPAIALLAANGIANGFGTYEKTIIFALWISPFLARVIPALTNIPVATPIMLVSFVFLLRHAVSAASTARSSAPLSPA